MERPFVNDIEKFIGDFVVSQNGFHVSSLIGNNPEFENADFYFKDQDILVELKCLQKDMFTNDDNDRNGKILEKWLNNKWIHFEDIIPIFLWKKELPEECLQDLYSHCRKSIQRVLEKGSKQLKITKEKIGTENTKNVLMLCNDGNYLFPIDMLANLIFDVYINHRKDPIDCIIHMTINQVVRFPGSEIDRTLWQPFYVDFSSHTEKLSEDIDSIGYQFGLFLHGQPVSQETEPIIIPSGSEAMKMLLKAAFIPKHIIYDNQKRK